MTNFLDGLNEDQRDAVESTQGPLLILAGPGSGKTRVITYRIAYILRVMGISPRRILAVTFTNKAASEMKERLNLLIDSSAADKLTVGTFHAVCAKMLRADGNAISIPPNFVIYDRDDQLSLVKKCMERAGISKEFATPAAVINEISKAKNRLETAAEYATRAGSFFEKQCAKVYLTYQSELVQSQALDFDDIIMKTLQMFDADIEVQKRYQYRYLYVMVDEFQDTSPVQYELVKRLSGGSGNICVVGDADQSIYSWRNADIRNIINFEKDFPQGKVIKLEQNYRSSEVILRAASAVIAQNHQRKEMKLWTQNKGGERITVQVCADPKEEGQFIVREIEHLVSSGKITFKDVAILYRTNNMSRAIEEAFVRYGVPYRLAAGVRFYERKEIKDLIAYLRLVHNPYDSVSLLRVINTPPRGLGEKSLSGISTWAEEHHTSIFDALVRLKNQSGQAFDLTPRATKALLSFYDLLDQWRQKATQMDLRALFDCICSDTKYKEYLESQEDGEERWENVEELRSTLHMYSQTADLSLPSMLENVALVSDVDSLGSDTAAVTLITLHQAKGLEFPVVFIAGLEENILPHSRSSLSQDELEEERRLFYVGITRAKKILYLTRCEGRVDYSGFGMNEASRFLDDLPSHLLKGHFDQDSDPASVHTQPHFRTYRNDEKHVSRMNDSSSIPEIAYEEKYIEIPTLKQGDKVRHPAFGEGIVLSYQKRGNDAEVVVHFWSQAGQKKLLASFANLNRIG